LIFRKFSPDSGWQLNLGPLQVNYSGGTTYNRERGYIAVPVTTRFWWRGKVLLDIFHQRLEGDKR